MIHRKITQKKFVLTNGQYRVSNVVFENIVTIHIIIVNIEQSG
jgi:hypothetical protein